MRLASIVAIFANELSFLRAGREAKPGRLFFLLPQSETPGGLPELADILAPHGHLPAWGVCILGDS